MYLQTSSSQNASGIERDHRIQNLCLPMVRNTIRPPGETERSRATCAKRPPDRARACGSLVLVIICICFPNVVMSTNFPCRSCHQKFDQTTHPGKRGNVITTCPACLAKENAKAAAKKADKLSTTFQSLATFDDFLSSLEALDQDSPYPLNWTREFRHPPLASDETLKELATKIARRAYEITGFRWT